MTWQLLPGSGAFLASGHLVRRRDLGVAAENSRRGVGRDSRTSVLSVEWTGSGRPRTRRAGRPQRSRRSRRPRRARLVATVHRSRRARRVTTVTAGTAGPCSWPATCHGGHGRRGAGHGRRRGHGPWSRRSRRRSRRHPRLSCRKFTAPVTAITESGQRARFPRRGRPAGQQLSPSHIKA